MSGSPFRRAWSKAASSPWTRTPPCSQSVIALQYNPDSLTRTLQIQAVQGAQDGDARRCAAAARAGDRDHQGRSRTRCRPTSSNFPSQFPLAVAVRPASATGAAGDAGQSDRRDAAGRRQHGQRRHARDHSAGAAAHALRLEHESRGAGAAHRLLHHRRSVRSQPQSDSRQGQPRACGC